MKPIPCCASDIFSQIPVESVSPDFLTQGAELSLLSGLYDSDACEMVLGQVTLY